jgi:hypothetical protein
MRIGFTESASKLSKCNASALGSGLESTVFSRSAPQCQLLATCRHHLTVAHWCQIVTKLVVQDVTPVRFSLYVPEDRGAFNRRHKCEFNVSAYC